MRSNVCLSCGKNFIANYKSNVCVSCESYKEIGVPGLVQMDTLLSGQPGSVSISRAERDEIKRGVSIPIGNGKFKSGRMGENGKIQERPISS